MRRQHRPNLKADELRCPRHCIHCAIRAVVAARRTGGASEAHDAGPEERLNPYGIVLAEYRGIGALRWKSGAQRSCTFQAFQLRDGDVRVLCQATDIPVTLDTAEALVGTTSDGRALVASGLFETNYLARLPDNYRGAGHAYRAKVLDVTLDSTRASSIWRFALTNLTLPPRDLSAPHPAVQQARISRVSEYEERIRRLMTVHGVDITACLEVQVADADVCSDVATDLCHLLSLACRVGYSTDGIDVHHLHSSRVTKTYCALPAIDPRQPRDMEAFLEAVIPRYLTEKDRWGLATGLLDAYLDAKAEADYLELRGVKVAVAIEMLKQAFIAATGQPEYAVPTAAFEVIKDDLRKAVRAVLRQRGWSRSQRHTVYANLPALNRLPFHQHVTALCANLDLILPEGDVALFVRCRDSLVHRGRFYTETADDEQRRSVEPHSSKAKEYFWLVHLLDRLFLRIVGYRGPYIDWSNIENPARKSTF